MQKTAHLPVNGFLLRQIPRRGVMIKERLDALSAGFRIFGR